MTLYEGHATRGDPCERHAQGPRSAHVGLAHVRGRQTPASAPQACVARDTHRQRTAQSCGGDDAGGDDVVATADGAQRDGRYSAWALRLVRSQEAARAWR